MFAMFSRHKTNSPFNAQREREFSELPDLSQFDSVHSQDYGLLAGGLALLLSRCSSRGAEREFKASSEAFRSLQEQMQHLREIPQIELPADLLNDVRHEVEHFVDVTTRAALRRCAERSIARTRQSNALAASNASRY